MNVYNDSIIDSSLNVPAVTQGHKMAVLVEANGNKLPLVSRRNLGSGGGNLVTPGEHCVAVDLVLPPGQHSYPISNYNISEDDAGLISIPKDAVQLVIAKQLIMVPGKTWADYGADGYTEYFVNVVLFRKCLDYTLLVPMGVFGYSISAIGETPDSSIVGCSIEADTAGTTTPYSLFRNSYVDTSIIDILPGATHLKVFLTEAQMPDGFGLEGTVVRTTLNFCKQSHVLGYKETNQGLCSILFTDDLIGYL